MLKFLVFDCLENSLYSPFISGAITAATIQIDEDASPANQFSDRSSLRVILDGVTTGGEYTSITWTRNSTTITNVKPVPGVPNSEIFIGGGSVLQGGDPCSARMYRTAILLRGYLPGVYQYTVDNAQTSGVVTSPTLTIAGMFFNNISALISFTISHFPLYNSTNFVGQLSS